MEGMIKRFLNGIIEDWKKTPLAHASWLVVFVFGLKLSEADLKLDDVHSFLTFLGVVVVAMIVEACVERFENNFNRMLVEIDFVRGIWDGIADGIADEVHEQYATAMEQAETPSRLREMKLGKTI